MATVTSEFFIPKNSMLLAEHKTLNDLVNEYHVKIVHVHVNALLEIKPTDLDIKLEKDMILTVVGQWEDVGRLELDCLTIF